MGALRRGFPIELDLNRGLLGFFGGVLLLSWLIRGFLIFLLATEVSLKRQ